MKFLIIAAVLVASATAIPQPEPHHYYQPTLITTHAKTYYAPLVQTNYGSHINHLVPVPAPIIKGVPQPYPVPVPEPYAVPRPVPVDVPRPVPVEVPRPVPIPLVAQAAPIVTKSVVHQPPVYEPHPIPAHDYNPHHGAHAAAGPVLLDGPGGYHGGGLAGSSLLEHGGAGPYLGDHGGPLTHGLPLGHYKR